jgi:hypothetical protein
MLSRKSMPSTRLAINSPWTNADDGVGGTCQTRFGPELADSAVPVKPVSCRPLDAGHVPRTGSCNIGARLVNTSASLSWLVTQRFGELNPQLVPGQEMGCD